MRAAERLSAQARTVTFQRVLCNLLLTSTPAFLKLFFYSRGALEIILRFWETPAKPTNFGPFGKMPLTMVARERNSHLTVVLRMPPVQTVLLSGIGPGTL